jgi:hypothetical protein
MPSTAAGQPPEGRSWRTRLLVAKVAYGVLLLTAAPLSRVVLQMARGVTSMISFTRPAHGGDRPQP